MIVESRNTGKRGKPESTRSVAGFFVFVLVVAIAAFASGCARSRTEMRSLLPAETLVYLETNDLGKLLRSLQSNKPFEQAMAKKTDFSALDGLQFAVGVTGFEATQSELTADHSVLNFKPRFVAVGDTHSWNRYTLKFVEETLGNFINESYGGEVLLESADQPTGRRFVWTATDGRKAYAFVSGSRIFLSNDETALGRSLAAARGEGESLAKVEAFSRLSVTAPELLAAGYVSPDGIAQLANFAAVSTALEATDDDDGRSFIARVLPELVRRNVREIVWSSLKTETGIEDRYDIALETDSATVFRETVKAAAGETLLVDLVPAEPMSATRYNLSNPQIAWRSLILVAGRSTDAANANIIATFAGSVLEPYGVSDPEAFLSAIGPEIWTVSLDSDGDSSAAVVSVRDRAKLERSLGGIDLKAAPEIRDGAEIRRSADGEFAAVFVDGRLVIGDPETAIKCLESRAGQSFSKNAAFARFKSNNSPAVTFGKEATDKTVAILGKKKEENLQFLTNFLTETKFTERGIERRTSSPFGLVGKIVEQVGDR